MKHKERGLAKVLVKERGVIFPSFKEKNMKTHKVIKNYLIYTKICVLRVSTVFLFFPGLLGF